MPCQSTNYCTDLTHWLPLHSAVHPRNVASLAYTICLSLRWDLYGFTITLAGPLHLLASTCGLGFLSTRSAEVPSHGSTYLPHYRPFAMSATDSCVLLGTPRSLSTTRGRPDRTKRRKVEVEEGFVPTTFHSSRSARASFAKSQPEDYMEESEREAWKSKHLGVYEDYETITQAMHLKAKGEGSKADEKDKAQHILGLQGDLAALLAPVTASLGMRLLGSRNGLPSYVAERDADSRRCLESMRRMARKDPSDRKGVGCFSLNRVESNTNSGAALARMGKGRNEWDLEGFGNALDIYGAEQEAPEFATIALHEEDSEIDDDQKLGYRPSLTWQTRDLTSIDGFLLSSCIQRSTDWFPLPNSAKKTEISKVLCRSQKSIVPVPKSADTAENPPVPPPRDEVLKHRIESLAAYVVRNGNSFEQLAKSKQAADPRFSFLFGGLGSAYYKQRKAALFKGLLHSQSDVVSTSGTLLTESPGNIDGPTASRNASSKTLDRKQTLGMSRELPLPATSPDSTRSVSAINKKLLQESLTSQFTTGGITESPSVPTSTYSQKVASLNEQKDTTKHRSGKEAMSKPLAAQHEFPGMSRTIVTWQPCSLVCKRFNIKFSQAKTGPDHIPNKPSTSFISSSKHDTGQHSTHPETPIDTWKEVGNEVHESDAKSMAQTFLDGMRNDPVLLEHMQQDLVVDEDGGYVRRPVEVFQAIFERQDATPGSEQRTIPPLQTQVVGPTIEGKTSIQQHSNVSKKEILEERIRELQGIFNSKHKRTQRQRERRKHEHRQHSER